MISASTQHLWDKYWRYVKANGCGACIGHFGVPQLCGIHGLCPKCYAKRTKMGGQKLGDLYRASRSEARKGASHGARMPST